MVDQKGLGRIGMVFALVTGAVVLTGALVVTVHRAHAVGTGTPPIIAALLGTAAR